jgi:hypothetical protein
MEYSTPQSRENDEFIKIINSDDRLSKCKLLVTTEMDTTIWFDRKNVING